MTYAYSALSNYMRTNELISSNQKQRVGKLDSYSCAEQVYPTPTSHVAGLVMRGKSIVIKEIICLNYHFSISKDSTTHVHVPSGTSTCIPMENVSSV